MSLLKKDRSFHALTPSIYSAVVHPRRTRTPDSFGISSQISQQGFTLLELLIVVAMISILMVLVIPAFTNVKTGNDISAAAFTITGVLERARTYAMSNNTYTYVGFYEEATTAASPTNSTPAYPGKGRIVLAAVASKDGTSNCEDPNSTATDPIPLIPSKIIAIGKLTKLEGLHVTDIGAPPTSSSPTPDPNSLDGRPNLPYTYASPAFDYQNRISSDDTHSPENHTKFPFTAQGYTFYKTVRFNPRGEASINATYELRPAAEIGLKPTHGSVLDVNSRNVIAIQFSGAGGNFKIYRR